MMSNMKIMPLVIALLLMIAGCGGDEVTQSPIGGDCDGNANCAEGICVDGQCVDEEEETCSSNRDCEEGVCRNDECVIFGFGEPCDENDACESGLCIEDEDGEFCSQPCHGNEDCGDDGWTCQSDGGAETICLPAPDVPPADGSTLCGAGGVSSGGGIQLTHCLAPYDLGSDTLRGNGANLESGGFQIITQ